MSSVNKKEETTQTGISDPSKNNQNGKQKRRERNRQIRQFTTTTNREENSLIGLPRITGPIDADRFALARIGEINDMQAAIKNGSYALTELAFQSLPRGLRRRAASHNINRLPARLRAKAAREARNSAPNTVLVKKRVRKIKPARNTVKEFLRRQNSKKWLETHMWHTKRMKMNDIWGYRIASRPNTKSVRVTYRSFTQLSIVHDASYMACVELKGDGGEIIKALNTVTDIGAPSVGSERYIKGNRLGSTNLYEYLGYPTKLICPISFLWKPNTKDTLWIWIHPSAFNEAIYFIRKAISETKSEKIQLFDLRDDILRFELTGPRSTALLQSILEPVSNDSIKGNKLWQDLKTLRSSCSLSPGSVIGLLVQDPRLKFPQKVPPRTNDISTEDKKKVQDILDRWPTDVADTFIWDKDYRTSLAEKKISEYHLNLRRQNNLVPGTKLEATVDDSQIPILLIQRGGPTYNTSGVTQKALSSHEFVEGWSVILPRGFGLGLWKSLVFAGARVAGYQDVRAMHFESGFPSFPQDYPGTRAFEKERELYRASAETVWAKRPPAKRVNFQKRGIDHPFESAFETLSKTDAMEEESPVGQRPTYGLVQGSHLVSYLVEDTRQAYEKLILNRGLQVEDHVPQVSHDDLLVKLRLRYVGRGKPAANALIYLLQDSEEYNVATKYIRQFTPLKKGKRGLDEIVDDESNKNTFKIPEKSQHIGYITCGDFSLTLGYGFGIGACTINGLKQIYSIDKQQNRSVKMLVFVRNTTSLEVWPAQVEVLY